MNLQRFCSALLGCALASFPVLPAAAQTCPSESGPFEARTLQGQLIFHDGIRKWFELKLDQPQCGEQSLQLVRVEQAWTPLQVLRSCRVQSRGIIGLSTTGYYSLNLYQDVQAIEPIGECARQLPFPDNSNAKPDKSIRAYRVEMHVDYQPGDHPIIFRVTSAGKELRPWMAYAQYDLTGGFVLYGLCGIGFVVDQVFGPPEASPSHFDRPRAPADRAMFDPESAAVAGKKDLELGYTCVRNTTR